MFEKKTFSAEVGGATFRAHFTNLAGKANGSVMIEADDTVVMVTATMSSAVHGRDYFPLSVEYEERFYAAGRILGSQFIRREGRPSQAATLNARLIDRTIRPLFPKGFKHEVQIVVTVLSLGHQKPELLGLLGASLALSCSDIPWNGPVSGVSLAGEKGTWKPFVSREHLADMPNQLLVCGQEKSVVMIEMEGGQVPEQEVIAGCEQAVAHIDALQSFQRDILKEMKVEKIVWQPAELSAGAVAHFEKAIRPRLYDAVFTDAGNVYDLQNEWVKEITDGDFPEEDVKLATEYYDEQVDTLVHDEAIDNKKRFDGRGLDEVRPLYAQAGGVSSRLHGSGLFYRGDTHVFTALTLGSPSDALVFGDMEYADTTDRYIHHYNFPPYSTGETGRVGSPKRREIGHGALAEKAVRPVLPSVETFPYTIRLVSECFSSSGSTSMASSCASTLALMDGGVPITAPVAGVAIGLMTRGDTHVVLTDIQGLEDHYGDMDFKIAGTAKGITAVQLDIKIGGLQLAWLPEIFERGKQARLHILDTLTGAIEKPRESLSPHAPYLQTLQIATDTIGLVIGSGGKTIREIKEKYMVDSIDIEDDGTVTISGNKQAVMGAAKHIQNMVKVVEVGEELDVTIKSVTDFGAFAAVSEREDGLIHISEFSPKRIAAVADIVAVGDVVPVVVKEVKQGRIRLSVKDRDPKFFDGKIK